MTENEKTALYIVAELKTSKQETRDAWKAEALEKFPQDRDFIETAYRLATNE